MLPIPSSMLSILLVCFLAAVPGVFSICSQAGMQQCMEDFNQYIESSQSGISWAEAEYEAACSKFTEVDTCVQEQISTCPDARTSVKTVWESVASSFQYICDGDNKNIYLKNAKCIDDSQFAAKTAACNYNFQLAIKDADAATACPVINGFIGCSVGAMKESCGNEVAEYILGLYEHSLKTTLDSVGCTLTMTVEDSTFTAGASSLMTASVTLMIALSAAVSSWLAM